MPSFTSTSSPTFAVIGAGLSGLRCASRLAASGLDVHVFDKGRAPGGRLSTRRSAPGTFDHGAQYFTARAPPFQAQVEAWQRAGVVAEWKGRIVSLARGQETNPRSETSRFCGVPTMDAVATALAHGLNLRLQIRVAQVQRASGRWRLSDDQGNVLGHFEAVVISTPAPQAVPLLTDAPALQARASQAVMAGCQAVMVAFNSPLPLSFDGAFVSDSPLSWIARDSSKPGRGAGERWVLHGSPQWSQAHLEDAPEDVTRALWQAFKEATGHPLQEPVSAVAHRWRHALPTQPLEETSLLLPELLLGACGDWCGGPRVEGAWLSGTALADGLMAALALPR